MDKETVYLTRAEAEKNFIEVYIQRKLSKIRAKAAMLSDIELEKKLEKMNDKLYNEKHGDFYGGGEKYKIINTKVKKPVLPDTQEYWVDTVGRAYDNEK